MTQIPDKKREIFFLAGISFLVGLIFLPLIHPLGIFSFGHPVYSHIPLIPIVSFCLFVFNRREIFSRRPDNNWHGLFLFVPSLLLIAVVFLSKNPKFSEVTQASILLFSGVLFWMGLFVLVFGRNRFLKASFPIGFLIFMIPLPEFLLDATVSHLQWGSSFVFEKMLMLTPAPILRDGLTFHFSTISVNIARECSGIRSSLSLVIAAYIISGLYLKSWWARVILILSVYPVIFFKNSLRIFVVTLLGEYVDISFITHGFIHKGGGFIFFGMALVILVLITYWLRNLSSKASIRRAP